MIEKEIWFNEHKVLADLQVDRGRRMKDEE